MRFKKRCELLIKIGLWLSLNLKMRPFLIFFDHRDTPYREECQSKGKYDREWKHFPYTYFLGHSVVKTKLFGIFTIFDKTKKEYQEMLEEDENGQREND